MVDNTFYVHLFRFYAKSLTFPYDELVLELQHIFRQLEIYSQNELDEQLAAHVLDILNWLQGEDMSTVQAEFSRMFTHEEGEPPQVSILFTDYDSSIQTENLLSDMYENMVEISYDESPDSMTNLFDYFAYLSESDAIFSSLENLQSIIGPFSRQLFEGANINYYKELAKGIGELAEIIAERNEEE